MSRPSVRYYYLPAGLLMLAFVALITLDAPDWVAVPVAILALAIGWL